MLKPTALSLGLATLLLTPAFAQKPTPEEMGGRVIRRVPGR